MRAGFLSPALIASHDMTDLGFVGVWQTLRLLALLAVGHAELREDAALVGVREGLEGRDDVVRRGLAAVRNGEDPE